MSYDNPDSFGTPRAELPVGFTDLYYKTGQKGQFIRNEGLAGFAMWQTGGDLNNLLIDAIKLGAGMT